MINTVDTTGKKKTPSQTKLWQKIRSKTESTTLNSEILNEKIDFFLAASGWAFAELAAGSSDDDAAAATLRVQNLTSKDRKRPLINMSRKIWPIKISQIMILKILEPTSVCQQVVDKLLRFLRYKLLYQETKSKIMMANRKNKFLIKVI